MVALLPFEIPSLLLIFLQSNLMFSFIPLSNQSLLFVNILSIRVFQKEINSKRLSFLLFPAPYVQKVNRLYRHLLPLMSQTVCHLLHSLVVLTSSLLLVSFQLLFVLAFPFLALVLLVCFQRSYLSCSWLSVCL